MNEIQTVRTVDVVAAEIRALTSTMLSNIIEIGRRMCEAKEMVPYGSFGEWLEKNTGYSSSTANNFMRLYQEYGAAQGCLFGAETECQTFGKLSYSKALALLAVPAEERESFAQQNEIESKSVREIKALIQERDEALQRAEEADALRRRAEDLAIDAAVKADEFRIDAEAARAREKDGKIDLESAERKIAELHKENKKLRERPIEVAVQVDEEAAKKAAEEAKAAADAEWGKKLSKVEKAAEKQVKELSGKAAEADKLREQLAEAERQRDEGIAPYEEQISALKKQLAMSGAEITTFKHLFNEWQIAFSKMSVALQAVPEEMRPNCEAAVKAVLADWAGK